MGDISDMQKLNDLPTTQCRKWYNNWVQENVKGAVLDVGKSAHWDYGFPTLDINKRKNPTYLGDITERTIFADEAFDVVLCNGLYETVVDPQKMIDEVIRITKQVAIFGFVGERYRPYRYPWKFYQGKESFPHGYKIVHYNLDDYYHFIVITKGNENQ